MNSNAPPTTPHAPVAEPSLAQPSGGASDEVLLRVENLTTHFRVPGGIVRAVDDVSLTLRRGRTLGVVGESGCGKSTLVRTILRLIPATSGRVIFDGVDLLALSRPALRPMRARMQIVFQDPMESLNPRLRVEDIVGEALFVHRRVRTRSECRARVGDLLRQVGLTPEDMDSLPHQFSGGQRQRIGIARALALQPDLVVCDEPVSSLDVSIQSQILNLLADLQTQFGLSYLFIAHDLAVVRQFCDDIAVMYLGRVVEHGPATELFTSPRHPYTRALLAAVPDPDPTRRSVALPLLGEPPSPLNPPQGCAFHPRCPLAIERCRSERPELKTLDRNSRHAAACLLQAEMPAP
jgi:oligopeptide/dipeptide ABC transporter ATP-binding protein